MRIQTPAASPLPSSASLSLASLKSHEPMGGRELAARPYFIHASCRYVGSGGVYTHTVAYERDLECVICGAGLPLDARPSMTLQELLDAMMADADIGPRLTAPSVSCGEVNL